MKKKYLTSLIATFIFLFFSTNGLIAGDETKKIMAEKSYSVNADADLVVNHEYGNVYCNNWDKNEIKVTIIAFAKTSNNEKAEKAFSRISWEVKGNSNEVLVNSKLTGKGGAGGPNIWVDIEIYMPKSINLNFRHKFGKAFIESVKGVALVTSDYGSISISELSNPESKLKVTYGEAQINKFIGNSMIVQYGKIVFDQAGDVTIRSDYSDIEGDRTGHMLIKLEGGNMNLDKVESIKGSSSFSSLNIDKIENSIDVTTSYGSFNVDQVAEKFSVISIENNFGSVNLGIPASTAYILDAMSTMGSIIYPEEDAEITYREKTTQKNIIQVKIGGSNASAKVNLKSNYGSITIGN